MIVKWIEICIMILSGLVICIPLGRECVEIAREAVQERNWNTLIKIIMNFMVQAELAFDNGADRKAWVMGQLEAAAKTANYNLTEEAVQKVSDMIDAICTAAETINGRG